MKKRLLLLTILALVLGACIVLSSCDKSNTDNSQNVTVTFDTKGGSAIESVQVTKGEKVAKPQDPQKEGYTLEGWYVDDEKWSFVGYVVTENMTLTAKWIPTTYTITYVGNVTHTNNTTYTTEDDSFELDGIAKDEYCELLGWYEDEEFTKPISKIEKGTVGDKTLYAKVKHEFLEFNLNGGDYTVIGSDADLASVVIPSTFNSKSVTSIGEGAFSDCENLISITIPDSVTSIGKNAFSGCKSLKNIEIPSSVTSIGSYAFEDCASLVSIIIRNSVTSMGGSVFSGCALLTVYCEAQSKPSGWSGDWDNLDWKYNFGECNVRWGYKQDN